MNAAVLLKTSRSPPRCCPLTSRTSQKEKCQGILWQKTTDGACLASSAFVPKGGGFKVQNLIILLKFLSAEVHRVHLSVGSPSILRNVAAGSGLGVRQHRWCWRICPVSASVLLYPVTPLQNEASSPFLPETWFSFPFTPIYNCLGLVDLRTPGHLQNIPASCSTRPQQAISLGQFFLLWIWWGSSIGLIRAKVGTCRPRGL